MWKDQVQAFGETYHAIAYSRRYNFPNTNELRPNHSAAVDAEDLADLMQELNLGKSHIVGFSYGGCSALFLAVKHPELGSILTSPDGLAAPEQERVRALKVPTLLLSGGKSAASCLLADAELKALLPQDLCERAVFPDATHAMWIEHPEGCRKAVLQFLHSK